MYQFLVVYILYGLGFYLAIGLIYAVPFAFKRVGEIDPDARDAGLFFRLLIIPGTIVCWPVLLRRDFAGRTHPPEESTAHKELV